MTNETVADDNKPVAALDQVEAGPVELEDDEVAEGNDHAMVGEPAKVNEWGDEIGDES